jgi:GR25 family glycosyltransferase involved in LPS biosynthesis
MTDFDPNIYMLINEDLKNTKYDNIQLASFHWNAYGNNEGRPSNIRDLYNDFRPNFYNLFNVDLQKYRLRPNKLVEHWLTKGRYENRKYKPDLNWECIYLYTDDLNYSRAETFSNYLTQLGIENKITTEQVLNTPHFYILFTHRQIKYFPYYFVLYLDNYDISATIIDFSWCILVDNLEIPENIKQYIHKIYLIKSENPEITLVIENTELIRRFLIGCQYNNLGYELNLDQSNIYCLTQIEYNYRLNKFRNQRYLPSNIDYINGIKHPIGWIGCGSSYKYIMQNAIRLNLPYITICHDDVLFNNNFNKYYEAILTYLLNNTQIWDVFIGINSYPDNNIKIYNKYKTKDGIELLHINQISSLAFVIFNNSSFTRVESWKTVTRNYPKDLLVNYLNEKKLKVLTTNPFLVHYVLDVNSTISISKKNEHTFNKIRLCENNILSKKVFLK